LRVKEGAYLIPCLLDSSINCHISMTCMLGLG
jgi:hypothetical protein